MGLKKFHVKLNVSAKYFVISETSCQNFFGLKLYCLFKMYFLVITNCVKFFFLLHFLDRPCQHEQPSTREAAAVFLRTLLGPSGGLHPKERGNHGMYDPL